MKNIYSIIIILIPFFTLNCQPNKKNIHTNCSCGSKIVFQEVIEDFKIDSLLKIYNINGKQVCLKEILKDREMLILRYSELSCFSCFTEELKFLNEFVKKSGENKILILSNFENIKMMKIFKKYIGNINIYNLHKSGLKNKFDEKNLTYYFLLNRSYQMKYIYIPNNHNSGFTLQYFKFVSQNHF